MKIVEMTCSTIAGGIAAPAGFRAAGVACGIKKTGLDVAVIVSDGPASAAGVFTTNKAVAAPVIVSREHLARSGGRARGIAINSGCANACTGPAGLDVAHAMADALARCLDVDSDQVLVASTGVIGVALDAARVSQGIADAHAALGRDGSSAARAIMTTDPLPKEAAVEIDLGAARFRVGGMAKGSGMIEPMMATMIGVVTSDAEVPPALLQRALKHACDMTFNAITVDGECSTNDCVFALANGESGVVLGDADEAMLVDALTQVCEPLARAIVRGGEGATKLVTITVSGARTDEEATRAARTIANSPLVKTAIHGADPNWGRVVAAAGRAGVDFQLASAGVRIGGIELFAGGVPYDDRAAAASAHLAGDEVEVHVDLGTGGPGHARMWTCDFSADYVRINAEYRT